MEKNMRNLESNQYLVTMLYDLKRFVNLKKKARDTDWGLYARGKGRWTVSERQTHYKITN